MATDAETGTQIDAAAVWRAIGRMEGDIAALKDGQEETNRRIEETNRRIDRTTYTILAVGSGLLVAILAANFVGS